jgi:hypothetical protein
LVVNGGGDQAEIVTKQQAVKSKRNRSMMKKCVNNNDGTWKLMPSVAGGGNDRYRWFNIDRCSIDCWHHHHYKKRRKITIMVSQILTSVFFSHASFEVQ